MKLKIKRDYLDFQAGKTYDNVEEAAGRYMIAMSIAKEVIAKDGRSDAEIAAEAKKKADDEQAEKDAFAKLEEQNLQSAQDDFAAQKEAEDRIKSEAVELAKAENPAAQEGEAAAKIQEAIKIEKAKVTTTKKHKIVPGVDIDDLLGFDN